MRKLLSALLLLALLLSKASAQQYSLYNSRTLFDSFENPSQKAFVPDSSRRFAISLFPTFGINASVGGPVQDAIKTLMFDGGISSEGLTLGEHKTSRVLAHINTYLFMLKAYTSLLGDEEMGLSWQIRSDNMVTITNETVAIFDDYNRFSEFQYSDLFNNNGQSQTFNQISFTYRRNYNKQIGGGIKLSYLSGIAYNQLKIDSSSINIDAEADYYNLYLQGRFRTSFLYDDANLTKMILPGFKNPGFAFSASVNYKPVRGGWYFIANLKDVGFINWSKKSYVYSLNRDIAINNASSPDADERLEDELDVHSVFTQDGFTTMTNGKAELLISKYFGYVYQPNLLLSKNLFYKGADIALINRFIYKSLNFSLSTAYNTSKILQVGGQFMVKTPNKEFFIGSDQSLKTFNLIRAGIRDDKNIASGYPGASFYIGFSTKFGYVIEHPVNANRIPDFNTGMGFFERMLRRIGIRL